jgi:CarD family transcriptional regulator
VELMMSIYTKQQQAQAQHRRLGMVDERFMKQAERLLYGELAVALEIPYDDVQPYIARRIKEKTAR